MRTYQPQDKDAIIKMIDSIYREYGDTIYLEDADSDLLDIESNYLQDGEFWVEEGDTGQIIACIAVKRSLNSSKELAASLKRFYVLPEYRGSGIAQQMHNTVIEWCKENYINQIYLWSDTRFTRAHSFYSKHGYEKKGIRDMNDGAMPYQEYYFVKKIIIYK
ncbi:N-acetyltransferase-like protein [Calothrix sp. NIES-4071]|nr:N-acetyltransferase-like protein [Calothrix sp. NIES-4071]BAZ56553.1 N-acetyltransferase-like protein [Calothrix sp. NIES-4105]